MDHLVILRRSWHLLSRILAGEKRVESRWHKTKRAPWDAVATGDTLYFKNSGEPVTAKATVVKVVQFANLDPAKIIEILAAHGRGLGIEARELPGYFERFRDSANMLGTSAAKGHALARSPHSPEVCEAVKYPSPGWHPPSPRLAGGEGSRI